jgi:hypothetical protein
MRAVVLKRVKERQRKTVKRPVVVLEGIAGRMPRPTGRGWKRRRTTSA